MAREISMAQVTEHPTVRQFREREAAGNQPTQLQTLDAAWLRRVCIEAGAFMAPAVTIKLFTQTVAAKQQLVAAKAGGELKFRMFSLNDTYECRDTLVRNVPLLGDLTWFYPRSLLYLISGILEQEGGQEVIDAAIVGLQRDYDPAYRSASDAEIAAAREFIEGHGERRVWSVQSNADARFQSNSTSHGGFAAPVAGNTTMESIAAILKEDW
jgi:hypothetical protein